MGITFWDEVSFILTKLGIYGTLKEWIIFSMGLALYVLAFIALIQIIKIPRRLHNLTEQMKVQSYRNKDNDK